VTIFARLLRSATCRWPTGIRGRAAGPLLALLAVAVGFAVTVPVAGAQVETAAQTGEGVSVGLQPRTDIPPFEEGQDGRNPEAFNNNSGNVVLDGTSVYAVYWDPKDIFFDHHHEWMVKLDTFFQQMGVASGEMTDIFGALGQYRDRANTEAANSIVYKGSYTDSTAYPAAGCTDPKALFHGAVTCLTDTQLRAQLKSYIAEHSLPTGMHSVYYLITPPGVTVCLGAASNHCSDYSVDSAEEISEEPESTSYEDSFCSYHSDINTDNATEGDANTIIYSVIPWEAAGTLGDAEQDFDATVYEQGYPCQDGGWNPEKNEERAEAPKEASKEEKEILKGEKGIAEEKLALEVRRHLEGPHQEEPNQEPNNDGKGESGDYSAGLADLIINQVAEEQADIVTDPLLESWQGTAGLEATDECRDVFGNTIGAGVGGSVVAGLHTAAGTLSNTSIGSGRYYVNNVYRLAGRCCTGGATIIPRFTAPNPVNSNEIVTFDGLESTVAMLEGEVFGASGPPATTYAEFTWNFGDGTSTSGFAPSSAPCEAPWLSPCAGSVEHSYQYGGTYTVTLTIKDIAGNVASEKHELIVDGPPAPSSSPPASSTGASSAATPPTTPASAPKPPAIPAPVAAATIVPQSLHTALRKGLVVSYSVNEQVAGHFEVLLSSALAHRLGIAGTPATGLPAGSAPQLVIAKAILVTTKGGHSAVHIVFSKRTAARLAHVQKLPLMLRLTVRNATAGAPTTTTVLSSVTLGG
jgi:hypothetical protein